MGRLILGQIGKRLLGYSLFALGWYVLMTRFVEGDWVIGLIGGMLIPISLGLIIRARRQMLSEIKRNPEEDSSD
ncbi:MAG: hypothetical protein FI694_05745 [SAR202 cluster bacterium]|nr:hypothetical protein [SAR202 cluster bacterium]MQG52746.1 hypothetical protein [SAR202 cluster bacterium]